MCSKYLFSVTVDLLFKRKLTVDQRGLKIVYLNSRNTNVLFIYFILLSYNIETHVAYFELFVLKKIQKASCQPEAAQWP